MQSLTLIDWQKMFVPEQQVLDILLRGTLVYLLLFLVMRFFLRRRTGGLGMADILVVVLIADAVQNAMGSDYKSVTEGGLLVLTISFWDFLLDWIGHRIPWLRRLTRPSPLLLIEDGRLLRRNMRQEMITTEELLSQLRQEGIDDPREVKRAFLEGDGHMSVLRRD
jgi:uncharacterized membrane protein YcaP (DUF421 family)